MKLKPILFVIGLFLSMLGFAMLVPLIVADVSLPGDYASFLIAAGITLSCGLAMAVYSYAKDFTLAPRQVYLLTTLSWIAVGLFSALPFMLSPLRLGMVDALFEAVSGITTTGSTVLIGLDDMPMSILLWRSVLQWIGGIGIIVMAVAVLPFLRVGGMRLFLSESSDKSEKITARSAKVAKSIGGVYAGLTALCAGAYMMGGMDSFNAICHAMTTLSTGGFSTSDLSIGQFAQTSIMWISIFFMVVSGVPFVLYVRFLRGDRLAFLGDEQVTGFIKFLVTVILITTGWLVFARNLPLGESFRLASFHITSIVTTTGFATSDYSLWGGFAVVTIFFLTFIGACAGSTSGGIKIFRFQLGALMLRNQLRLLAHPSGLFPRVYSGKKITDQTLNSVVAFCFCFTLTVVFVAVGMALTGSDTVTSLSAAAAAVANVGPGLGDVVGPAGNYSSLSDAAKILLALGMLMGRLEILTVLVLFSPTYWR